MQTFRTWSDMHSAASDLVLHCLPMILLWMLGINEVIDTKITFSSVFPFAIFTAARKLL